MSVAPEVVREPEIEMRPEPEIATCEKGLGASRSYSTDAASLLTLAEIVTAHASKEVTETTLFSAAAPYQAPYPNTPFHKTITRTKWPHVTVRRTWPYPPDVILAFLC